MLQAGARTIFPQNMLLFACIWPASTKAIVGKAESQRGHGKPGTLFLLREMGPGGCTPEPEKQLLNTEVPKLPPCPNSSGFPARVGCPKPHPERLEAEHRAETCPPAPSHPSRCSCSPRFWRTHRPGARPEEAAVKGSTHITHRYLGGEKPPLEEP